MYQTREQLQERIAEMEETERKTLVVMFQEMRESKRLRAENARLLKALEELPHTPECFAMRYPDENWNWFARKEPKPELCTCVKKEALARTPEAKDV